MSMEIIDLRQAWSAAIEESREVFNRAIREGRAMNTIEQRKYDLLMDQIKDLRAEIDELEAEERRELEELGVPHHIDPRDFAGPW